MGKLIGSLIFVWFAVQILVGADLTRAAQLIGHERWTGKDYYVTAIIHGRTLESGAVLQIVDPESSEVFVAEVISINSMGIDLELDLYRQDHNQHLFLEVPMDGVDVLQR